MALAKASVAAVEEVDTADAAWNGEVVTMQRKKNGRVEVVRGLPYLVPWLKNRAETRLASARVETEEAVMSRRKIALDVMIAYG